MATFVKADGRFVHFDVRGADNGPAIVLVEGLGAHLLGWRDGFCQPLLDAGFRAVRLDNRDVGLSSHYPGEGYRLSDMAEDVHALIVGLDLAPAHIVGQSMGGMIAQRLVTQYPEVVASLSLLYTAPDMTYLRHSRADLKTMEAAPWASGRTEAIEQHIINERVCASSAFSFDEVWKRHLGGLMYDRCFDPEGVVRQRRAMEADHFDPARLSHVAVPTQIIHGTADALIDHEASISLQQLIPGSSLLLVEGMGHDLPVELWPLLTSTIIANIRRTSGTGANAQNTYLTAEEALGSYASPALSDAD